MCVLLIFQGNGHHNNVTSEIVDGQVCLGHKVSKKKLIVLYITSIILFLFTLKKK